MSDNLANIGVHHVGNGCVPKRFRKTEDKKISKLHSAFSSSCWMKTESNNTCYNCSYQYDNRLDKALISQNTSMIWKTPGLKNV